MLGLVVGMACAVLGFQKWLELGLNLGLTLGLENGLQDGLRTKIKRALGSSKIENKNKNNSNK